MITLLLAATLAGVTAPVAAQDVTGEQVKAAIARGVRAIKLLQDNDGTWPGANRTEGVTCLATLALLQAGESPTGGDLARSIEFIRQIKNEQTYVVSLKIMVLAAADAKKYRAEIQAAAKWLISTQLDSGLWTYTASRGVFDNSNSQFALLGLHSASLAGIEVPPQVWNKARNRVLDNQANDGGWSYQSVGESYGSMTAAGVANLLILGMHASQSQESGFRDGVAPDCGKYAFSRPLTLGLGWLSRNFTVDSNPGRGAWYTNYWLYAVERVGILSGRRYFGPHDWYRKGAAYLVREQNNRGLWGNGVIDGSLAVLFLAKGHKPLMVQKLAWSGNEEQWNPDRRDLENLISVIGDKFGEPTAWQVVDFDAPLEEWLAAPLLYMQGHQFPVLSPNRKKKLRDYIEKGGTLFVEACCGREAFQKGFEQFCAETFPEYPLHELDPGHPVYHAHHDLPPSGLRGIDMGCRTSIIYSPRDLSCLWEQAKIPLLSEQAFQLGTNICAFAVGRQGLRDRLDVVTLPTGPAAGDAPITTNGLRLAQVVYDGDWSPDPLALVHFAVFLRDQAKLDVITAYRPAKLTEGELFTNPILFMTGHYAVSLSDAEKAALAAHLRRGGFLLAEACCGRPAFDESFRRIVKDMFPGEKLEPIPLDHPIFQGKPGFKIDKIGYKPAAVAERADLDTPQLLGLTIGGRLVLVYSPYSLGCGMDGHKCFNCRGVVDDDAKRLAANVVLWALTH